MGRITAGTAGALVAAFADVPILTQVITAILVLAITMTELWLRFKIGVRALDRTASMDVRDVVAAVLRQRRK